MIIFVGSGAAQPWPSLQMRYLRRRFLCGVVRRSLLAEAAERALDFEVAPALDARQASVAICKSSALVDRELLQSFVNQVVGFSDSIWLRRKRILEALSYDVLDRALQSIERLGWWARPDAAFDAARDIRTQAREIEGSGRGRCPLR